MIRLNLLCIHLQLAVMEAHHQLIAGINAFDALHGLPCWRFEDGKAPLKPALWRKSIHQLQALEKLAASAFQAGFWALFAEALKALQ